MYKRLNVLVVFCLCLTLITPFSASAGLPTSPERSDTVHAYAPPPPTPEATPPPVPPLEPGTLPDPSKLLSPELEQARAQQAIEAVLEKYLRYWGPRYQVAPVEVAVEGEWAHGVAQWKSKTKALSGPIHILAHRLPDGAWQALMPSSDGLYLQWVDTVPESLVPAGEKSQLHMQAGEADALRKPMATPVVPPAAATMPPSKEKSSGPVGPIPGSVQPTATPAVPQVTTESENLLYPKLVWSRLGAQTESVNIDGSNLVGLPGVAYQSHVVFQKPSSDVMEYYSPEHLSEDGWQHVGSAAGVLAFVDTYFKSPNRYITVRIVGHEDPVLSEQSLVPVSDGYYITVWISSPDAEAPTPIIPTPQPQSSAATPFLSSVSPAYQNPLPVPLFSQNGIWKGDRQGWPDTGYPDACNYSTLGDYGCWTTSYAMLYNYYQPNYTDPRDLNNKLNTGPSGGPKYAACPDSTSHCNNCMPGGSPYAPAGVSRGTRYYNACTQSNCIDPTNVTIIDNEINAGRPLLAYVHYSGTSPQHMIVIVGHSGNTYYINDPWDGEQHTLASGALGAYVVDYIYQWNGTPGGGDCPQSGGVILYWNANYNCTNNEGDPGYRQRTGVGWQNVDDGQFNDKASSVKVPSGWSVRLFANANCGEPSVCFNSDVPDFGTQGNFPGSDTSINDNVSSIEVFDNSNCSSGPPPIYWEARYDQGFTLWWDPNASITPRCTETINGPELHKDWGSGAPCGGMNGDDWVGDFRATINFSAGEYVFYLDHDDGVKLWLNGQNIADLGGSGNNDRVCNGQTGYPLNGNADLRVLLREQGGEAKVHLTWNTDTHACIPPPPHADFDASPLSGNAPLTVSLHNTSSGDYTSCYWEYGDGSTGTSCNSYHDHTYINPGSYTARLTVTGPGGSDIRTRSDYISVNASPDWYVEYFSDNHLGSRCYDGYQDGTYVFGDWRGDAPAGGCPSDYFSARFSRSVYFPGGDYTFALGYDDGARIKIDGQAVVNGWAPSAQHYETRNLSSGYHNVEVEYYENAGDAYLSAFWWGPGFDLPRQSQDGSQWYAQYWGNRALWWDPVVRINEGQGFIDHQWDTGGPGYNMPNDRFSSRFERIVNFACGRWRFNIFSDDGVRFWVDDNLILDEWQDQATSFSPEVDLSDGGHQLRLEHYENGGSASIQMSWEQLSGCPGPLVYDSHVVDDDNNGESRGDGDGIAECGETIELYVVLHNQGYGTATGVNAVISTGDPYITWLYNTSSGYPDISGGGTGTNSNDFDFTVDPNTPNGHVIQLHLDINASNGGPWSDSFNVPVTCLQPDLVPSQWGCWQYPIVPSSITGTSVVNTLYAGQPTYIDWGISNSGNADTGGSTYGDLYIDSTRVAHYDFGDVEAGATWAFFDWVETIDTPGWHTLRFIADADDLINESNETNNSWEHQFYWIPSAPYSDNMESGTNNWTATGLWHQVDANTSPYPESHSWSHSWWYGQDATGDYDTGSANSGGLTSPSIYIPTSGYYLRFWYWYETETQGPNWDQRWVQISVDDGPFNNVLQLSDDPMNWWLQSPAIDLSGYAGHAIQVRFYFDSLDSVYNDYRGWYIDDFDISTTPPPSCADSHEPNNTPAEATSIAYGQTLTADICPGGDYDFYTFTGAEGDRIVVDIDAKVNGSSLDSYVFLLDSYGNVLAEHDDEILVEMQDSHLGYQLPHDGTYYIKVRAWNHPSVGGTDYFYAIHLLTDDASPTAEITSPDHYAWLDPDLQIITTNVSDGESGIRNVTFYWHDANWDGSSDWVVLEDDHDPRDGWTYNLDTSSIPEQPQDCVVFIYAYDWAGNYAGYGSYHLGIDRTPPTVTASVQQMYRDAPFRDFWVRWWDGYDNLSGIASYDVQYRDGAGGTWTDLLTDTTDTYYRFVGQDGHIYYFRARARDYAGNESAYAGGDGDAQHTVQTCSISPDGYEADNAYTSAKWIYADESQVHNIHTEGDQDWIKFQATAGFTYTLSTTNDGGHADTVLYLYDTDGVTLITSNDDYPGIWPSSQIDWRAPADGVYYVKVEHWDPYAYGCTTAYGLSVGGEGLPQEPQHDVYLPIVLKRYGGSQ